MIGIGTQTARLFATKMAFPGGRCAGQIDESLIYKSGDVAPRYAADGVEYCFYVNAILS